jgi:hypothetical protein
MKEIFISYSTIDTAQAETVRNVLEKNGISCWMAPRDIPGGSNYTKEIPIAIRNCKIFVLILSKNAQSSHWVLKELDSAVNCGKIILPFMLEDCLLNDEFNFLLTGAQRYAAYQKKAEVMENFILRIKGILALPSSDVNEEEQKSDSGNEKPDTSITIGNAESTASTKIENIFLGQSKCTACGSSDLKTLKGKVKRQGVKELWTIIFIPIGVLLFASIVLIVSSFILPADKFSLLGLFLLLGGIIGGILADLLTKKLIAQKRLRNKVATTCYRCNRCKKIFNINEKLED